MGSGPWLVFAVLVVIALPVTGMVIGLEKAMPLWVGFGGAATLLFLVIELFIQRHRFFSIFCLGGVLLFSAYGMGIARPNLVWESYGILAQISLAGLGLMILPFFLGLGKRLLFRSR